MTPEQKQQRAAWYLSITPRQEGVTIFLDNGIKLSGIVTHADEHAVYFTREGVTQVIFWEKIATTLSVAVPDKG